MVLSIFVNECKLFRARVDVFRKRFPLKYPQYLTLCQNVFGMLQIETVLVTKLLCVSPEIKIEGGLLFHSVDKKVISIFSVSHFWFCKLSSGAAATISF